ncbi:MAG: TrkA family potassium uptake protein, partial [Anaerolineales bacterium]|nr:TrkA family potassium uptake protein [Anaerolineales bacterium]
MRYGVLGIDRNRAIVQSLADQLPNLLVMDATDEDALAAIEIATFDMVLVAIGDDLARAIILVIALKDMGVRHVICKAMNDHDGRILLRVGADEIVMPEYEYGRWTAERLAIRGAKTVQEVEPG